MAGRSALALKKRVRAFSSNWKTRDPEFPIVSAIGCSNRSSPQGSRMGWDLGSRSPVRLFANAAATCGLSQPLAPVSLFAFHWIKFSRLATAAALTVDWRFETYFGLSRDFNGGVHPGPSSQLAQGLFG